MVEWIKEPGRTAWSIEFVPGVWDIGIARDSTMIGRWRMTCPGDGSYSTFLDCADDLAAAQAAALRRVADDASDRIKSDTEIRDAALRAAGLPAQAGLLSTTHDVLMVSIARKREQKDAESEEEGRWANQAKHPYFTDHAAKDTGGLERAARASGWCEALGWVLTRMGANNG